MKLCLWVGVNGANDMHFYGKTGFNEAPAAIGCKQLHEGVLSYTYYTRNWPSCLSIFLILEMFTAHLIAKL